MTPLTPEELAKLAKALTVPIDAAQLLSLNTILYCIYDDTNGTFRALLHKGAFGPKADFVGVGSKPSAAIADAYRQLAAHWEDIAK